MPAPPVLLLPPSADLAGWAAAKILERHAAALPDLSQLSVLLPAPAIGAFRRRLLRAAGTALLGPRLCTLQEFARGRGASPQTPLTALDCRLLIVEALRRHRALFEGQDPWRVAEALFTLFEEMTEAGLTPPGDESAFGERLAAAYGAPPLAALSFEARRVYTLWRAFQEDSGGASPASVRVLTLRQAFAGLGPDERVYLIGPERLTPMQAAAIADALPGGRLQVWLQGRLTGRDGEALAQLCRRLGVEPESVAAGDSGRTRLLDAVFAGEGAGLAERAAAFTGRDVATSGLRIVKAAGPEHEARCVELAVRRAWLDGARDIGIIAPDRRLARRVRALLERAGLPMQDHAGWALSTSRAAASLACWLDCIERDFHYRPLLDLLKSGFLPLPESGLDGVRRFEREVVYGGKIESGLRRYLVHCDALDGFVPLLKQLAEAARKMPRGERVRPLADWIGGLVNSVQALGLWQAWQADAAGQTLAAELDALARAAQRQSLSCSAGEFRALLDRMLEQASFTPSRGEAGLRLLTLEQSALLSCEVLIVSGATRTALPGMPPGDPFFNDGVRAQLGLPAWRDHQALSLARFRRVLEAAPQVWLTYAPEAQGEAALLSPWLEAVDAFCATARLPPLHDTALAELAGSSAVEITQTEAPAPKPAARPAPAVPAGRVPVRFSAGRHQMLVDCPYQFYARRCLELTAPEDPDQEPDRRDYGERVHRILHAFHVPVDDLPPPFPEPVSADNRAAAQAHLEQLAQAVFAQDVDRRIVCAAWVQRFRESIPVLLDWLQARAAGWPHVDGEIELERELEPVLVLEGRADRIERNAAGEVCIVDYKSGSAPKPAEVESGEDVQLVHYALLEARTRQVEYWNLKESKRQIHAGEALTRLRTGVRERLVAAVRAIRAGAPLPAHGDEKTCGRCDYRGLCRRDSWSREAGPS